jgi:uncharacterized membrane protein YeaQ/YmgE (transglycosylase-associated protein family)
MGILAWIVFGFFAGLVARALMPGKQKLGFILTTLLGVGGSFTGGAIATFLAGQPLDGVRSAGFIGSVIGALVLLGVFSLLRKRGRQRRRRGCRDLRPRRSRCFWAATT